MGTGIGDGDGEWRRGMGTRECLDENKKRGWVGCGWIMGGWIIGLWVIYGRIVGGLRVEV